MMKKKQRIELTPKGELQYWAGGWDFFFAGKMEKRNAEIMSRIVIDSIGNNDVAWSIAV